MFSVHMRYFFHGYDERLCFLYIWADFTMGMVSGGCVFCPNEVFFPGNDVRGTVFSVPMRNFFHGYDVVFRYIWANFTKEMMSVGCVLCLYGEFFHGYDVRLSKHLDQFYHGNDVRGLCFLSMCREGFVFLPCNN